MTDIIIRQATVSDFNALGQIMFAAVREGESPYSASQREAWMPTARSGGVWNKRLSAQYVLFAETEGSPIGFMSLAPTDAPNEGYVDFAYILPEARGKGLFRKLYEQIKSEAISRQHSKLFTHASLMAAPAFAKMGFEYLEKEEVEIGGEMLPRFHMHKGISSTLF